MGGDESRLQAGGVADAVGDVGGAVGSRAVGKMESGARGVRRGGLIPLGDIDIEARGKMLNLLPCQRMEVARLKHADSALPASQLIGQGGLRHTRVASRASQERMHCLFVKGVHSDTRPLDLSAHYRSRNMDIKIKMIKYQNILISVESCFGKRKPLNVVADTGADFGLP